MISCQEIFHRTSIFVEANFFLFSWSVWKVTTFIKLTRVKEHEFNSSAMFKHWKETTCVRYCLGWMIWYWKGKLSWLCILKDLTYGVIFMQAYLIPVTSQDREVPESHSGLNIIAMSSPALSIDLRYRWLWGYMGACVYYQKTWSTCKLDSEEGFSLSMPWYINIANITVNIKLWTGVYKTLLSVWSLNNWIFGNTSIW